MQLRAGGRRVSSLKPGWDVCQSSSQLRQNENKNESKQLGRKQVKRGMLKKGQTEEDGAWSGRMEIPHEGILRTPQDW